MKPALARDVLREKTAYGGSRLLAGLLLLLSLIGSIGLVVGACTLPPPTFCALETFIIYASALAAANALCSIMAWCLVQAAFDIADARIADTELERIVA